MGVMNSGEDARVSQLLRTAGSGDVLRRRVGGGGGVGRDTKGGDWAVACHPASHKGLQ